MKKMLSVLVLICITVVVVLFPDVYYEKQDEIMESYHREESYNLNRVSDIDMKKKLDILTDEKSLFIDRTEEMQDIDNEALVRVISQVKDMFCVKFDEFLMSKNAIANGVKSMQVLNTSSYNVYSIDLKAFSVSSSDYELFIVFDANEEKIVYGEISCFAENDFYIYEEDIMDNVKEYYGDFSDWNLEVYNNFVLIDIGSIKEVDEIISKVEIDFQEDVETEIER